MSSNSPTPDSVEKPRRRGQIWILIAVFFAPLIIAFVLYYGVEDWRPSGQTNHGDLIHPPRPVPAIPLPSIEAGELPASTFKGKWTLVYVGTGACDTRCREALTLMRQTRLALNDDMTRVQRLFLVTNVCCDESYLQSEHPGLLIGKVNEASASELLAVFQSVISEPLDEAGQIFIVDPLGNLMMSYSPAAEPKGLLMDLKKLLKLSHIG